MIEITLKIFVGVIRLIWNSDTDQGFSRTDPDEVESLLGII